MEEDIKILEELLKASKENDMYEGNKYFKSLEYFIKEYQDLKEIEESHRKENGELREKVKQLEEENKTLNERNQYLVKYRAKLEKELYESNENYIPVSLVEEKIEELNKEEQELQNSISDEEREEYSDANISFELMDIEIRRSVLQELLEKRK